MVGWREIAGYPKAVGGFGVEAKRGFPVPAFVRRELIKESGSGYYASEGRYKAVS